jgi:hypothetical protein
VTEHATKNKEPFLEETGTFNMLTKFFIPNKASRPIRALATDWYGILKQFGTRLGDDEKQLEPLLM